MVSRNAQKIWASLHAVLIVAAIGCGRAAPRPEISGVVLMDGRPLANAVVSLVPRETRAGVLVMRTDDRGMFSLTDSQVGEAGVGLGEYTVQISTFREAVPRMEPPLRRLQETVPARYNVNSTLTVQINPGPNQLEFSLQSQGEIAQPLRL